MNADKHSRQQILTQLAQSNVPLGFMLERFCLKAEDLYSRKQQIGHVTASAVILDESLNQVFLIKHKSLGKWLVPGGHGDPGEAILEVARREAFEETGFADLRCLSPDPIHIDIHQIPESSRKAEPAHWHFDCRFLFTTKTHEPTLALDECLDFKWVLLTDPLFEDCLRDATQRRLSDLEHEYTLR